MGDTAASPAAAKPSSSVKLVLLGEAAVGKSSLVLRFTSSEFHPSKEPTIGAAFLTKKLTLPTRTIKFEIWDTAGQERFASLAPMYYRNAQAALVVYDLTKQSSLTKARHWVAELQRQASPGIVIGFVGNKRDLVAEDDDDGDEEGQEDGGERERGGDGEGGRGRGSAREEDDDDNNGGGEARGGGGVATAAAVSTTTEGGGGAGARRVTTREAKTYADEEGLLFFETSAKTGLNVNEVFTAIANAIPEANLKGPRSAPNKAGQPDRPGGGQQSSGRVDLGAQAGQQGAKEGCAC